MDTIHPKGSYHVHAMALNVEIAAMAIQPIIVLSELRVPVSKKQSRAFLIFQVSTYSYEPFLLRMTAIAREERPMKLLYPNRQ